jgi:hypothetical protein
LSADARAVSIWGLAKGRVPYPNREAGKNQLDRNPSSAPLPALLLSKVSHAGFAFKPDPGIQVRMVA